MITLGCDKCLATWKVRGTDEDIRRLLVLHPAWVERRPCVTPPCDGQMRTVDLDTFRALAQTEAQGLIKVRELTVEEAFRALCGFGLPDETKVVPQIVDSLMRGNKVLGIVAEEINERTLLHAIHLEGGVTLHLCAGPQGATVFKMTRRPDGELQDNRSHLLPKPWPGFVHGFREGVANGSRAAGAAGQAAEGRLGVRRDAGLDGQQDQGAIGRVSECDAKVDPTEGAQLFSPISFGEPGDV